MINFDEKRKSFHLKNNCISYIFYIMKNGHLGHAYYGESIEDDVSLENLVRERGCVLAPCPFKDNMNFSLDIMSQEYPCNGTGDFRDAAFSIRDEEGSTITNFKYHSHTIKEGKEILEGLPSTFATKDESMQLEVCLYDDVLDCKIYLSYTIFKDISAIVRSARFVNGQKQNLFLEKALSLSFDLFDSDYKMLTLDGAWSRERHLHEREIREGQTSIESKRGASSIFTNPFFALKKEHTTEHIGDIYGVSLIYSGNFKAVAEVNAYDSTRVNIGINPYDFEWKLEKNESFITPEAICVYSPLGVNGMSQNFHKLFKKHLMKSKYSNQIRPILINNWEATYFDFTEDKILQLAKGAKDLGIELFVLDDGWFGQRNIDTKSLGDWDVNFDKLPSGIEGLAKKITDMGLKFGLWFEPEMVNEDSNLFREHEDFVIGTPNRSRSYGRNQFVLDFANKKVVDYIFEKMSKILDCGYISYIKWDMNRNITEQNSQTLDKERKKEFFHRYILGVYDLYERLTKKYPDILFESCASGGGRFDPGMLYYAPQAWCSDDTDAIERLEIQYGTSIVYPVSSMGSHVSASPNHQIRRSTSLKMRGDVAAFGTFGYELDITKMSNDELNEIKEQIIAYKKYRETIQLGTFYRLLKGKYNRYAFMSVSESKDKFVLGIFKTLCKPNPGLKKIKLKGLDENAHYKCNENNKIYGAKELMNFGFMLETEFTGLVQSKDYKGTLTAGEDIGDFTSCLLTFNKI